VGRMAMVSATYQLWSHICPILRLPQDLNSQYYSGAMARLWLGVAMA